MRYRVKDVSELTGVSIRALHHYDGIGLLKPAGNSAAGYRLYDDRDLERLQQILFLRELDFPLGEIRRLLDRKDFDRRRALRAQRALLKKKRERLDRILGLLDRTLRAAAGRNVMAKKEWFDGFDATEIEAHRREFADETRARYGGSDAYRESQARTEKYTPADWKRITASAEAILGRIAGRMDQGPEDPEVQKAVGDWRRHISRYYYDCGWEIFRGLGELYAGDPRFAKNLDRTRTGLAAFLSRAIRSYCDRK